MKQHGSLGYLTKEGFRNIRANKLMSFASVAVLMSCLVLIGAAFMLFANIDAMIGGIEEQNVIMVYIEDNTSDDDIYFLEENIKALPNVKECNFISKETAFAEQLAQMGDAATLFSGLEDNPLPDAYEVTVSDMEQFSQTVDSISKLDHILNIRQNQDFAKQLSGLRRTSGYISIAVILMLFIVSLFIISNTVKLTMYGRRLEISIMKSVGATKWFIRWPFMIEGIVLGIIAGVISLLIVYAVYMLAIKAVGNVLNVLSFSALPFENYAWMMLLAFTATGVVTGALGSTFSMNKYLKEQEYDIIENN